MRLLLAVFVLFSGSVLAEMNCEDRTAVVYSPGPKWPELNNYFEGHLGFITKFMKSGDMEEAGPFKQGAGEFGQDNHPTGGLMIFKSLDKAAVLKMVSEDPFISNNVAIPEVRTWMKCTNN